MKMVNKKKRLEKRNRVCQRCIHGNNDKGKYIYRWYRRGMNIAWDSEKDDFVKVPRQGHWHVYCERKLKHVPWDAQKRCFKLKKEGNNL